MQSDHVSAACGLSRQIDGGLDGVAAAHQKERFLQWLGQQLAQSPVQFQSWHVEHGVGGVDERIQRLFDRRNHARMAVTDGAAHLSGLKIQIFLALDVDYRAVARRRKNGAILESPHVARLLGGKHPAIEDLARLFLIHLFTF